MKRLILILSILSAVILGSTLYLAGTSKTPVSQAEYGDITLNHYAEQAGMPPVIFPHWFHRIRFKCKVCHEDIFIMKQGANDINMYKIVQGDFCGRCHNGKIAWAPLYCDRCHSGQSTNQIPKARGFVE
jgi:c(7)-type cytochrome triheme protein